MSDPTLTQLSLVRRQAAAEPEAAEAAEATLQAQLAAATAFTASKRDNLAAAERALREAETDALKQLDPVAVLPIDVASLVFALLPMDSRMCCREVCCGWRAFLADARHWQVLDLSLSSGVARRTLALLHAACELAQGELRELDVSGWYRMPVGEGEEVLRNAQLLPVLLANADSLLELRTWWPVHSLGNRSTTTAEAEQLLAAAPRLRLLECDASLDGEYARGPLPRLLREPQFAPLRLRTLDIYAEDVQPPPDVPALAAWAATHASLKGLDLGHIRLDSDAALDAVVHMAMSQLQHLVLGSCSLSPASLPALTRMLGSRSLTSLRIYNRNAPLLLGAAVPAFCAALRACRLVRLGLCHMRLWESQADGLAIVAACMGHPTLRMLFLNFNDIDNTPGHAAIDAALDVLEVYTPGLRLTR